LPGARPRPRIAAGSALQGRRCSQRLYPRENRFGPMSPDAWQWLGWQARDPKTGQPICYPLEIYGPV